ncbi:MAG: hypothetical protein Q8Q23_00540 [bacterium]|nr:hypothetical protein [bacterium]
MNDVDPDRGHKLQTQTSASLQTQTQTMIGSKCGKAPIVIERTTWARIVSYSCSAQRRSVI